MRFKSNLSKNIQVGWTSWQDLNTLKKEVKAQREIINALPTAKDLQIEGLKSEKRMIQATDRKILDVQRQTQIEQEIKKLEK
mgnify:CR=1 FL=1